MQKDEKARNLMAKTQKLRAFSHRKLLTYTLKGGIL